MKRLKLGIDIGSTTAKLVVCNEKKRILHSTYVRHNLLIQDTLKKLLLEVQSKFGDVDAHIALSGSAAMGIAESLELPFIQEVVAAASLVQLHFPGTKSLIDIGGEDAKLVIFDEGKTPDIRMNGSCAGGTGAYIDQMAGLLNVSIDELDKLARESTQTYPIASRCGVFAKTDVQNLISRKINNADIAASIFEAVAGQTINTLARGKTIKAKLLFTGGPLTYISYLREAFVRLLDLKQTDIIVPGQAQLFTAQGAALAMDKNSKPANITSVIQSIKNLTHSNQNTNRLKALFDKNDDIHQWRNNRGLVEIPQHRIKKNDQYFLGIDSGSTTTKVTIINQSKQLVYHFYRNNRGKPLETVIEGLKSFFDSLPEDKQNIQITRAAATGYGEELIKSALGIDEGLVETMAHFMAARHIEPEVSFILDIGGQDIKAISVQNGSISNIEINEACSSGCGSFIEGFAKTLGYSPNDFSELALTSDAPYDLGTRCTVFMNSKVKQALRDGATVPDVSAGLSYSVIKNCLNKVLRIKSANNIGNNIVVQGGTFKNEAVFRSLEVLSGKKIVVTDKPELMGAYGAALYALEQSKTSSSISSFIGFRKINGAAQYKTRMISCKGCTNQCNITTYRFNNNKTCYSGHKCEKVFSNHPEPVAKGTNIIDYKRQLLFDRQANIKPNKDVYIGIPRVLNLYENYPFWHTLLTQSGFNVRLSETSSQQLYKKGVGTIMADNMCFPAKLAHGHMVDLIEKKVDRIFMPFVVFEQKQFRTSVNSYNCPIVTSYADVLKNTVMISERSVIPFDSPAISFKDTELLKKACFSYLKELGVDNKTIRTAFNKALLEKEKFKRRLKDKNKSIYIDAVKSNRPLVLLIGQPYHVDTMIHQQVSQMLIDMGVSVINEDMVYEKTQEGFKSFYALPQWAYTNRTLQSVFWATQQKQPLAIVKLNSFGCGPDSFILDEIDDMTRKAAIPYALIRIDEIASPGSIKLRLRSLVESLRLKMKLKAEIKTINLDLKHAIFEGKDKNRTLLAPWFTDFHSPFAPAVAKILGYKMENLPPSDQQSVDFGLEYADNEVCFPATLVVGDIIKVLKEKKYHPENVAFAITQTGGQCRFSSYISLIKRALTKAGFENVPVISIAPDYIIQNPQPGFKPNFKKIIKPSLIALLYSDSLAQMYYPVAAREKGTEHARATLNHYIKLGTEAIEQNRIRKLYPLLIEAIEAFNKIPVGIENVKKLGIVGEVYIKYSSFGQSHILDWLTNNNVEAVMPKLTNFYMQSFECTDARTKSFVDKPGDYRFMNGLIKAAANHYIHRFEKAMTRFKYFRPDNGISHAAKLAKPILNLNNQAGEGWLIPADVATFAEQGINDIICVQPFGCIANHITGKGMEMKIKELYPNVNMLFLDFDPGTSKVNILNRIHFLLQSMGS